MTSFWSDLVIPPIHAASDATHYYALIDAAQMERFSRTIFPQTVSILGRVALFGEPLAPDRYDATPHLLELTGEKDYAAFFRPLARAGASHGAISCLTSPLELPELAVRLKGRLDARLPDDVDCVNRFFDGRITPHLSACLDDEQRAMFFSVAEQWFVVAHDFQWQSLPCQFAMQDAFSAPLLLDTKQEAYLIDRCYPYALIEHFERTDPDLLDTVSPSQRYRLFQTAINAASAWGIDSASDVTLFCTLCLTRGENFYEEAPWQEKLPALKAGKATLQQLLKSFYG